MLMFCGFRTAFLRLSTLWTHVVDIWWRTSFTQSREAASTILSLWNDCKYATETYIQQAERYHFMCWITQERRENVSIWGSNFFLHFPLSPCSTSLVAKWCPVKRKMLLDDLSPQSGLSRFDGYIHLDALTSSWTQLVAKITIKVVYP